MKTIFNISILAVLLGVAASPCFAMRSFGFVNKERAKEMGMEMRFTANGTHEVLVELEFKTEGYLKNFSPERHSVVELQTPDATAALQLKQPSPGHFAVSFRANGANLDKISLWVRLDAPEDADYIVRVRDFIELEKVR
jgi:predicted aspartyl protease